MIRSLIAAMALLVSFAPAASAQEFISLWEKGKMPHSKGMELKDDIRNERIYQAGGSGLSACFPSQQEKSALRKSIEAID